jgi:hypothetical protein
VCPVSIGVISPASRLMRKHAAVVGSTVMISVLEGLGLYHSTAACASEPTPTGTTTWEADWAWGS